MPRLGQTFLVIPDCQVRPDVDTSHLEWIGRYIVDKKPDRIICLGDFADVHSLNSYAVGKAESEGSRYTEDVRATKDAMARLLAPLARDNRGRRNPYRPPMDMCLGNHEDRITREAESNPKLIGVISIADLGYREAGWIVHPFLKVITLAGIEFSHYFTSGPMGRPVSSAAVLLRTRQRSAIQGHVQHTDLAFHQKTGNIAMFAGCAYLHDEKYLSPQGNSYRRQIWMLHECDGSGYFDPMAVSLRWLKAKYG